MPVTAASTTADEAVDVADASGSAVSWAAILAGALTTAAMALVLVALGAGFGLSSLSPWSSTGATLATVGVGAAIWLIIVQWLSAARGATSLRIGVTANTAIKAANTVIPPEVLAHPSNYPTDRRATRRHAAPGPSGSTREGSVKAAAQSPPPLVGTGRAGRGQCLRAMQSRLGTSLLSPWDHLQDFQLEGRAPAYSE
jgi:hypothetical protein